MKSLNTSLTLALALVVSAPLGWAPLASAQLAPSPSQLAPSQELDVAGEQSMLARINAMRAAQGLAPLIRHGGLDAAARAHSADMASEGALSHVSARTGTPADRARAAGVSTSTLTENVALHRSTDEAHAALLASDAHRANMLGADVTHVGLAALRTERGVYVTQVFAGLAAAAPPPPVVAEVAPPAPIEAPALVPPPVSAPAIVPPPASPPMAGRVEQQPLVAPAPPAPASPSMPAVGALEVQAGSGGTVVLNRVAAGGPIQGYWIYDSSRWWYFPMPPGAQPGQQLQHDPNVQGPPPGFPAHLGPNPQAVQPMPGARPQAWGAAPAPRPMMPQARPIPQQGLTIDPYAGRATITIAPTTPFYAVPPPPMTSGQPTRAWRRAQRNWERAYRRWQRGQRRGRAL